MRLRTADIYGGMIPSRLREDETLPALAQSIARHGLLQPIVVQENPAPVFWRSISRGRAFRFWKRRGF